MLVLQCFTFYFTPLHTRFTDFMKLYNTCFTALHKFLWGILSLYIIFLLALFLIKKDHSTKINDILLLFVKLSNVNQFCNFVLYYNYENRFVGKPHFSSYFFNFNLVFIYQKRFTTFSTNYSNKKISI